MAEKKIKTTKKVTNKDSADVNVFAQPVKTISPVTYFFIGLGGSLLKAALWILDLVISVFLALWNVLVFIVKFIYKGVKATIRFFKNKAIQFKYNDWSGRMSFLFFGTSSFAHGQIVNGIFFILFEIGFIVFMALGGGYNIYMLGSLGLTQTEYITTIDPQTGIEYTTAIQGDNSILILIVGILTLFALVLFFYIWNRSIESGYANYRIKHFTKYERVLKSMDKVSFKLDEEAKKAFDNGTLWQQCFWEHEEEINQFLAQIEEKKVRDYCRILLKDTIHYAYDDFNLIKSQEKQVAKLKLKLEKYRVKIEAKYDKVLAKNEARLAKVANGSQEEIAKIEEKNHVALETFINKAKSGYAKRSGDIRSEEHSLFELNKRHASYVGKQLVINNDKFGKFNRYYSDLSDIQSEIDFYEHYNEFIEVYNASLGGSENRNKENASQAVKLGEEMNAKLKVTDEKFTKIRERKAALEAELKQLKLDYAAKVKDIKANGNDATALNEAKLELIDKTTVLMRKMNDLPSKKTLKALEKEEISESKHAYKRDKKYLKTNFTPTSFAREEVINLMILKYKLNYADAVYFANSLFIKDKKTKKLRPLNEEELEVKLYENKKKRDLYLESHPDKYFGRPTTFKEQFSSLLDDKFHLLIFGIPALGILLFSVAPLFLSILVAFTNFDYKHLPPNFLFTWVGLENFMTLFNPPENSALADLPAALMSTVGWTFTWAIIATFSNYFLGIIVALMINKEGIRFKTFWRTVFVLSIAVPSFVTLMSIGALLKDSGAFGQLWLHMTGNKLGFGDDVFTTRLIIILVNIWVGIPYTILSTTGILLNIPKDLYESARVDGAGPFTQFSKITLPYIFFVTGPYLITQFVGNINNFNVIFFLSGGGPVPTGAPLNLGKTDLLITFLYKIITANNNQRYGLASAVGIIIFVICAFFSLIMYNRTGSVQSEDQFQ